MSWNMLRTLRTDGGFQDVNFFRVRVIMQVVAKTVRQSQVPRESGASHFAILAVAGWGYFTADSGTTA